MTEPRSSEPRVVSEARIDEIAQTWGSASEESMAEMLEDLRVVIEDDLENWQPDYLAKAHELVQAIASKLPDTADPEPAPGDAGRGTGS